jgi:hypothetical protein
MQHTSSFAQLIYLPLLFEHDASERPDEGVDLKFRLGLANHVALCGEMCFARVRVVGQELDQYGQRPVAFDGGELPNTVPVY